MSQKALFMLLFSIVGGSFGQNCGPNDFYNPDCLNTDWCSDIHQKLNPMRPCHYSKLENKAEIIDNKCCNDQIFSNEISHMFTSRCSWRYNGQDVCRKPNSGSVVKLAKKFNNCPMECTTKVKLYGDEYRFQGGKLTLESTFKYKDDVYVDHQVSSCEAYTCGYEDRDSPDESWNKIAKTCLCLKPSKRTELNNTIGAKWKRCERNSLNENPLACSEPKQFDETEYQISGDKITIDYPPLEIHKGDKNYCFGPRWTENEDTLVKMKLFFCKKDSVDLDWKTIFGGVFGGLFAIAGIILGLFFGRKKKYEMAQTA